jgi:class 3 adenylate cyclase
MARLRRRTDPKAHRPRGGEVDRRIRGSKRPPAAESAPGSRDRPAEHRIIVVVDVEGFTDGRRNNNHQMTVRKALYRVFQAAFGDAGIPWDTCRHEDRGDGIFTLAPAAVHKAPFVDHLPTALAARLRDHNAAHPPEEQIRLRMALHAGEVVFDAHGAASTAINQTSWTRVR